MPLRAVVPGRRSTAGAAAHQEFARSLPGLQSSITNRVVSAKNVVGIAPHFEKMLYDNALLSRVYLHAYQASGDAFYRRVAQETLDYVVREKPVALLQLLRYNRV